MILAARALLLLALPWLVLAIDGIQSCTAADGALADTDASDVEVNMLQRAFGLNAIDHEKTRPGGKPSCPCIGISHRVGEVMFDLNGTSTTYPIDAGSYCRNWDFGSNPACRGDVDTDPDWCYTKWCFVDACQCDLENTDILPSLYIPNSRYQNRKVFFSYETCGYTDTWSKDNDNDDCRTRTTAEACARTPSCSWTKDLTCAPLVELPECSEDPPDWNSSVWGNPQCKCIGFTNLTGFLNVYNLSRPEADYIYEPSTGSHCKAWDWGHDNYCHDPKWAWTCTPWCHVDLCECGAGFANPGDFDNGETGALYLGSQVWYSYAACGDMRYYNHTDCPIHTDEASCHAQSSCSWFLKRSGKMGCLEKALESLCVKKS